MTHAPLPRLAGLLLAAGVAWAQEGPLTLRGFGTLGVVRTDTDEAEFIRDVSQPRGATRGWDAGVDSRLGLQANLRLGEAWEAVAQGVSRRRYDATFKPDLAWAFLKWRATDSLDLRAGRLGFDVYQLADTRNVGYSYLWVRPPVEFYGGLPITDFVGADAVLRGPVGGGFGQWKVFGGKAKGRIPTSETTSYDLTGAPLMGTHGDFRRGPWSARLALAQLRFQSEFRSDVDAMLAALRSPAVAALSPGAPALADELAITDKWARYVSLSLAYEEGPAQALLGLSRTSSQSLGVPTGHAGYLTFGYRFGAWTPYLNVAAVKTARSRRSTGLPDLPPFAPLNAGLQQYLATNQNDQRTLSLGLRWDFQRNLSLKAQVDAIHAREGYRQLWWRPSPTWNGHATVASLALDFVF